MPCFPKRRDRGETQHMDHISRKGYVTDFFPPRSGAQAHRHQRRDGHPGCQGRSRQRMGQVENLPTGLELGESQTQEVFQQAKKDGRPFHCASLVDNYHLKHSVVLRGDVKDDSGCVVFTEKSSASQVAANILDTLSRLPGMAVDADAGVS